MSQSQEKRQSKGRAKAIRAYELSKRGHDLLSIAKMCNILTGSVSKRIELGARLKEAGIK